MSVIFYTTAPHENIVITSTTSTATGYDRQSMLDQNLNTIWKPTSTSDQNINIDCGEAVTVDAWGLWIANYNTNFSTMACHLYYSSNGSSYTYQSPALYPTNGTPLAYTELATQRSYRYWRIRFESVPAVPQIAHIFLLRKREVTTAANYPFDLGYEFDNQQADKFTYPRYTNKVQNISRSFMFAQEANKTAMLNAFDDCHGSWLPFVFKEGSNAAVLCRFASDKDNIREIDYQVYTAEIDMATLPYIEAGKTY